MAQTKTRDGAFNHPDTATLPPDGGPEFNRLVFSSSPYLLQHARNPVDWYPWGEEAFARAKAENKPVFLSIGYSTCHWCHVMEHESFEDPDVAEYLNAHYVSIKVDREERPDIDNIYMTVCQAMAGSGGWPLSIIMTPDTKPFFAGTYFPREDSFGRPGFKKLLFHLHEAWEKEQDKIAEITSDISDMFGRMQYTGKEPMTPALLDKAVNAFSTSYDKTHGGFAAAPKFPMAHTISFLLQRYRATGDRDLRNMAEHTLRAMYDGGMYDHLGYGFCRYSTDGEWLVPHFEKMLYDNALLMMAYTDAFQLTGNSFYRTVVEELFTYVRRELTEPQGAFYSAENADSEGEEGKFYAFTYVEFMEALGNDLGMKTLDYYGVVSEGNWEDGKNVIHRAMPMEAWAAANSMDSNEAQSVLDEARSKLFDYRAARLHPSLDDKVLTNWNGLMIAALAKAGFALNDDAMIAAARKAADFILVNMRTDEGTLLHRYRNGDAAIPGFVDDYAFFVWGLIELYQATFEAQYLAEAVTLNARMLELFEDERDGGLFYTAHDAEQLLARTKDFYDGALPSGNSVGAFNCLKLARMTGNMDLHRAAERIMTAASTAAKQHPSGSALMLSAWGFATGKSREIVIAAATREEAAPFIDALRGLYQPQSVTLFHPEGPEGVGIRALSSFIAAQAPINGKPAVYVCEDFACNAPVTSAEELLQALAG